MVKLECNNTEEAVELSITVEGRALDIGIEVAEIVTVLSKTLIERAPLAFEVMRQKVKEITDEQLQNVAEEIEEEESNVRKN